MAGIAKLKSGKIITGKLADTFIRVGIATEIEKIPDISEFENKIPDEDKQEVKKVIVKKNGVNKH